MQKSTLQQFGRNKPTKDLLYSIDDIPAVPVLLGTCGWSYQEWVGMFYPNNRVAKLPFYCKVFDTVEVDSSFYRTPSKSMVKGWVRAMGPSFKFSLKVPKTVTHDRRLADAKREFQAFLDVITPLKDAGKLGCLLVQLPPSFTFDEMHNLEAFMEFFPRHMHFAVEFRHESWDREETWELLKKYGVANTVTDSPLEFLSKPIVTADTHAYVRWHGRGKSVWFDYTYSEEELETWTAKVGEMASKVQTLYAYFNNHYRSSAPINALQFLEMSGMISEPQSKLKKTIARRLKRTSRTRITDFIS